MDAIVRRKSESECQERPSSQSKQYTRNIQRIFNHESNFRFRQLENYDEDKELLSPTESEHDDLLGLGNLALVDVPTKELEDASVVPGTSDSVSLIEAQKELIIIDTDITAPEAIKPEPPPLRLQPVTKSLPRKYTGISSSPYKDLPKSRSKSMSPDNIDFCPNNWFEVKKDVEQEELCEQVSWKCCFLCVCLPLCYPCYLTRTLRKKKKAEDRFGNSRCLVTAGQQELQSSLQAKHCSTQPITDTVNVIILQSNSASRLIRELEEQELLETDHSDLQLTSSKERSGEASPVVLRNPGKSRPRSHNNVRKPRNSEVFYSLESNLDQRFPLKVPLSPPPTAISEVQSNILSSLPSMTSGRFFSANSSVFSGISSPRSDLSPMKDPEVSEDRGQIGDHIEPVVEIVGQGDNVEDSTESIQASLSQDSEKKKTITSLEPRKSFIKKSLSVSSRYGSITKVCDSNEELAVEVRRQEVDQEIERPGVKVSSQNEDISREGRKYSTLPAKQRLASYKNHKLGLKQLGLHRSESIPNCPATGQQFYEEGELSSWSTKDIHDIVSKDLPRMDIVVMVVNQEEKKMIDKTLGRATGVVGYIREYWSGFFPLLLIEIAHRNGETDLIEAKSAVAIQSLFSVTHRIIVNNFHRDTDFILESVARFYNHISVFQCEKFQQSLHTQRLGHLVSLSLTEKYWFCSGLCQMRVSRRREDDEDNSKASLGLFQTVRRTIRSKYNFDDSDPKLES